MTKYNLLKNSCNMQQNVESHNRESEQNVVLNVYYDHELIVLP